MARGDRRVKGGEPEAKAGNFRLKHIQKRKRSLQTDQKPKKRGPPFGHTENSRKCLDRADTIIALELEACPYYGCEVKGLEDARVRYEEETIPIPPFVIKYLIKQGYCKHSDKVVYPEVPETIDNRHFGIRFLLYIAYLRYALNLVVNTSELSARCENQGSATTMTPSSEWMG